MPRRIPSYRPPSGPRAVRVPLPIDERAAKAERDYFYSSTTWERFRRAFLAENPLCVQCLERGRFVPATIVHHKKERLERPDLALDERNCESLCSPCHTRHHKGKRR